MSILPIIFPPDSKNRNFRGLLRCLRSPFFNKIVLKIVKFENKFLDYYLKYVRFSVQKHATHEQLVDVLFHELFVT